MSSLVSIIIPTYNRCDIIGETLNSIIAQTYSCWECIVVDDGSIDYTIELMEFYCTLDSRIIFIKRPAAKQKGANACRNYGFKFCNGEFVNWFDSDDLMHPEFLRLKIDALKKTNSICCISKIQKFSQTDSLRKYGKILTVEYQDIFEDLIMEKIAIPTHNPMWRKKYLLNLILFDEELQQSQDLDFHSRIFYKEKRIETVEKVLLYMRTGHDSISNNFYLNLPKYFYSFLKVRTNLLILSKENLKINKFLVHQSLGIFRYMLSLKDYKSCNILLNLIKSHSIDKTLKFKFSFYKIIFYYWVFRILGKGETRFKSKLFLP